jgi:hypothetical protein
MTSSTTPKVILLRGDPIAGEGTAAAAIIPGMALAVAGTAVSPAGAGATVPRFAREFEIVGRGIDGPYAIGERVLFYHGRRGDWFYALLGAGANVAAGAALSTGAGGVMVATGGGALQIATALETVNNSAGSDPVRIKVEIV